MKPDKATVYEIFQLEKRYVVPLYQRPYVWTLSGQWEPLWEDIEAKALAVATGEPLKPHFLGAIVLSQSQVGIKQIAASQVIDGQQRLTTLQIVLAAFRDVVGRLAREASEGEAKQHFRTIWKKLAAVTEHADILGAAEEQFKVWPTNADRAVFQAVMTAQSREALDAEHPIQLEGKRRKRAVPGPKLVEAYRFFESAITNFLTGQQSEDHPIGTSDAVIGLFEAMRRALQLVVIDLEPDDDPQIIFETLNARGEPLLPSDLIRNLVFSSASGTKEAADPLYEELWEPYDRNLEDGTPGFWKQKVKVGRENRPLLDLFFQHYLSCRSERMVPLGHLYDEFRGWWQSDPNRKIRASLEEVRRFSDAYRDFRQPDRIIETAPRLAVFAQRLQGLDTGTVYPVLLFLVVEAGLSDVALAGIIEDLESFLVRRWVCGVSSKNYNRYFATLLNELRAAENIDRQVVQARLLAGSGVDRWPDDQELEENWLRSPAYERFKSPGCRLVLLAIHAAMLGSNQEDVEIKGDLTVEHVMPQRWAAHWPPPRPGPDVAADEERPEERRARLLHSFGNLTLLTHPLNSEVSNGAFHTKRPQITEQSLLRLNAYFQRVDNWDEEAILERGRSLLTAAVGVWPRPDG